jgi:hypothetical protein
MSVPTRCTRIRVPFFWKLDTDNLVQVVGMGFGDSRAYDLHVPMGLVFKKNGTRVLVHDVGIDFRPKERPAAG